MKRALWVFGSLSIVVAVDGCSSGSGGSGGGSTLSITGGGGATSTTAPGGSTGAGGGSCDPFTGMPCDVANGETCDFAVPGFACFGPPPANSRKLCQVCGQATDGGLTDLCGVGFTCLGSNRCAAFCCDDHDCGTGECDKSFGGDPDVGVCVDQSGASPACDAPAEAPSHGSCFSG